MSDVEKKIKKKKDNHLNNSVSKKDIDEFVDRIFNQMWDPKAKSKGPKRLYNPGQPVPYVIKKDGHYWLNPMVFSWTKTKDGAPGGYATVLVNKSVEMDAAIPRAAAHVLIWRWANGYAKVPDALQVSHLSDQVTLVSPDALVVEEGVVNRARSACQHKGWHTERRGDFLRCPHDPPCIAPVTAPCESDFLCGLPPGTPFRKM